MDLREIFRKKIIDKVLAAGGSDWRVFVYDDTAGAVLLPLFSRLDIMSHKIIFAYHIDEERQTAEYPVVYFVSCDSSVAKRINGEIGSRKYPNGYVKSLIEPTGLDPSIPSERVDLDIRIAEKRVFLCPPERLTALSYALDANLIIKYHPSSAEIAEALIKESCEGQNRNLQQQSREGAKSATIIIMDRSIDMYTPFAHFFTFKTAVSEVEPDNFSEAENRDIVWSKIEYQHLADVSKTLKAYVSELHRNLSTLNKKNLDISALSKMVMDAPEDLEKKDAVEKYSNLLGLCLNRLKYLEELVEAEQLLMTDYDEFGKRVKKGPEYFFNVLRSSNIPLIDRIRLLYIMRVKGMSLTKTEKDTLKRCGFRDEDMNVKLEVKNHIRQEEYIKAKFKTSRYEPVISRLATRYMDDPAIFRSGAAQNIPESPKDHVSSLRRSSMITVKKNKSKRIIILYMKGGITLEERRVVYSLSEQFGVDFLIGSDRNIYYRDYMDILRNGK